MENEGSPGTGGGGKGFMLFGVRVIEGSFRKSASTNNLAQFDHAQDYSNNDVVAGYASDDVVHTSDRSRQRKRGVAWSEEEHKLFLLGLQTVGKGDWRGISRNFVKTRTPTQVASHAQKYFLRRNNHNRRRRRSSLFDITTEAVLTSPSEDQIHLENLPPTPTIIPQENITKNLEKLPIPSFPKPLNMPPILTENPMEKIKLLDVNQLNNSPRPLRPIPILPSPPSAKMANLDLNTTTSIDPILSLNLSPPSPPPQPSSTGQPGRHPAAFKAMPASINGSGGDNIISVA